MSHRQGKTQAEPVYSQQLSASNTSVPDSVLEPVGLQKTGGALKKQQSATWDDFVGFLKEKVNKSLFSLLKSAVVVDLKDDILIIGYKNIRVFNKEKRETIEEMAKLFFNESMRVQYQEEGKGIDSSIQVKQNIKKAKAIEKIKDDALEDPKLIAVQDLFPGSTVKEIEIISQEDKNGRD